MQQADNAGFRSGALTWEQLRAQTETSDTVFTLWGSRNHIGGKAEPVRKVDSSTGQIATRRKTSITDRDLGV